MSNKSNGSRFEQELARRLADAGFWVHVLQQNKAGQPADIIAVTRGYCTLIDCKDVAVGDEFRLSRVEENQKYAMGRFEKLSGHFCWFAVQFTDGQVYMLRNDFIMSEIDRGKAGIRREEMDNDLGGLCGFVYKIDKWLACFTDL